MNPFEQQYRTLLQHVLDNGESCKGKKGFTSFMSTGGEIKLDLSMQPFPILSVRKMDMKNALIEIIGALRGINNAQWYKDNGCGFWLRFGVNKTVTVTRNKTDEELKNEYCSCGDKFSPIDPEYMQRFKALAERSYLDGRKLIDQSNIHFFKEVIEIEKGDMGPTHAKLWRSWPKQNGENFDQVRHVFDRLATQKDSHQPLTVTGILPVGMEEFHEQYEHLLSLERGARFPSHLFHTYSTSPIPFKNRLKLFFTLPEKAILREKYERYPESQMTEILDSHKIPTYYLDLTWGQQNWDLVLGLPNNVIGYAAMLMMMAKLQNMVPRYLRGIASTMHVYNNHLTAAAELLDRYRVKRIPRCKPKLTIHLREEITFIDQFNVDDFVLVDYLSLPVIKTQYAYSRR